MKSVTVHTAKKEAFDAVRKAAKKLSLRVERSEYGNGTLTLYHDGGILSFGNKIHVRVSVNGSKSTTLKISSQSAAQIQVIDWGTNQKLEADLARVVKNILAK